MYIPSGFQITDAATIHSFMKKYSFVTIIGNSAAGMEAAHVPVMLHPESNQISFHVAAANPISKIFETDPNVLVIFQGPHAYISPRWYAQPHVPTWNYTSIHVYGSVRKISDPEEVQADLRLLVSAHDTGSFSEELFTGKKLELVNKLAPAITGYRIEIQDIQAKFKLSQNRDPESIKNVIDELSTSLIEADRDLGIFMQAYYEGRK